MTQTCYMCPKSASSFEHAPPKCIFPEQKDLPATGQNLRKNLITVPSCDEHNTQMSKDDEYFLNVLSLSISTNNVGAQQFFTKIQRAIKRNPSLLTTITSKPSPVTIRDTENNTFSPSMALEIDLPRILKTLDKTARAIYFNHTKAKYLGNVSILVDFILDLNRPNLNLRKETLFKRILPLIEAQPYLGENPEVFSYRFIEQSGIAMIELNFYGANKAIALMSALSAPLPTN